MRQLGGNSLWSQAESKLGSTLAADCLEGLDKSLRLSEPQFYHLQNQYIMALLL